MGGRTEIVVRAIEEEILVWLEGETVLKPGEESEDRDGTKLRFPGVKVRHREDLREVSRNPLQLVCDTDDALARYVVHCLARYHEIVSFSTYYVLHMAALLNYRTYAFDSHAKRTNLNA